MNNNAIINWTNVLKYDDQSHYEILVREASVYKNKGYKKSEVEDIFVSKNYQYGIIESALENVYPQPVQITKKASRSFPTSYKDCYDSINNLINNKGAKYLLDLLIKSENPIIKVSQKEQDSIYRIAHTIDNSNMPNYEIHNFVSPWIEEELFNNVVIAKSDKYRKIASTINYKTLKCNCTKFNTKSYEALGLVCEHLIKDYLYSTK